ncbi:MAG: pyridoxal-phosphate dependent enzyme, partial [Thermoanaerobaculia bacterium]
FKLRGAANRLLTLSSGERANGVVTASTGNHGSAVAYLLRAFGWPGTIYVPKTISAAKLGALERLEANLELHGDDGVEAEIRARQVAHGSSRYYVSPYNDLQIIAGQGTVALEIERQLGDVEVVVVPVGGGGLISGIAGVFKAEHPETEIIGCQPTNSAVMHHSIQAGKLLELDSQPTLADGAAGGIESDAITFPICQQHVDRFVLVSEEEIRQAIRHVLEKHHLLIEGAAALSVAAFLQQIEHFRGRRTVLVLSGAKISLETLSSVLA